MKRSTVSSCILLLGSCAGVEPDVQEQNWRTEELEREVKTLRQDLQTLERRLQYLEPAGEAGFQVVCSLPSVPKIDGKVMAITADPRLVVLDRGSDDGVVVGHAFSIFKERTFKGQVRVLHVESHRAVGVVLGEKNPIAVGDSASTGI